MLLKQGRVETMKRPSDDAIARKESQTNPDTGAKKKHKKITHTHQQRKSGQVALTSAFRMGYTLRILYCGSNGAVGGAGGRGRMVGWGVSHLVSIGSADKIRPKPSKPANAFVIGPAWTEETPLQNGITQEETKSNSVALVKPLSLRSQHPFANFFAR